MSSNLMKSTAFFLAVVLMAPGCAADRPPAAQTGSAATSEDTTLAARIRMVDETIKSRGVRDRAVLNAMRSVPRHRFVPAEVASQAYADHPLPIGYDQTISQPYIVAFMAEALMLKPGDRVLEVGTGSGYHAAVIAEIAAEVYTIEIVPQLAERAADTLAALGYDNVHVRHGDGYEGWPEHAPFDAILVTAAPDHVPPALVEQLRVGGRMIIPVGRYVQELRLIRRTERGVVEEPTIPVRFVPMTGKAQEKSPG